MTLLTWLKAFFTRKPKGPADDDDVIVAHPCGHRATGWHMAVAQPCGHAFTSMTEWPPHTPIPKV
jgi:hypothetical protein